MGSGSAAVFCWGEGQLEACLGTHSLSLSLQYSTKEDKYEEEIKLLGEKLKEVRGVGLPLNQCRHELAILNRFLPRYACVFSRFPKLQPFIIAGAWLWDELH